MVGMHLYIGHTLEGEVPASQVGDLHLPTFTGPPESNEGGGVASDGIREESGNRESKSDQIQPFLLSDTLPLVPVKLVERILKGEYLDMAEFLKNNMEVERRRALAEPGTGQSLRAHHPRREVPDVLSWLRYFSIYAAVICSKWPEKNRQ